MAAYELGPVLNTLEFDTTEAVDPWPIHLDGDYYAVVNRRSNTSLWIRTYRITSAGVISEIDTWDITPTVGTSPRIFSIGGTTYAITYNDQVAGNYGNFLKTITISDVGIITKSFLDSEWMLYGSDGGILINLQGSYFALLGWLGVGYNDIFTFTISDVTGVITGIDQAQFSAVANKTYAAGKITPNICFAIVSRTDDYIIYSIEVSNTGFIVTAPVASQIFSIPKESSRNNVIKVNLNIYAIAIRNDNTNVIHIQTFQINNDGSIEATLVDEYTFGSVLAGNIGICETGISGLYFVSWQGTGNDGFVDVIQIDSAGSISDHPEYSALEFDTGFANNSKPLSVNGLWFPIFYSGPDNDGFLKSVNFAYPAAVPHHEMIMKIGP